MGAPRATIRSKVWLSIRKATGKQRHNHFRAADGHVPKILAGAGLSEDLVQERSAAGAKERRLNEGIFFLKAVDDLFALIQSHRG
jgi:hypothetical protein